ncbi:MAG: zf-HC2 domain-containing protein [Nitrospirota bacterium]
MTNCPDDNDMACYIDGLLSNDGVRRLESHLLVCDRCREIVVVTKKVIAWIEG